MARGPPQPCDTLMEDVNGLGIEEDALDGSAHGPTPQMQSSTGMRPGVRDGRRSGVYHIPGGRGGTEPPRRMRTPEWVLQCDEEQARYLRRIQQGLPEPRPPQHVASREHFDDVGTDSL